MAKPKIGLGDIKKAVDIGKEVLPYVEPAVKKYAPIVAEQFGKKLDRLAMLLKVSRVLFLKRLNKSKTTRRIRKSWRKLEIEQ